MYDLYVMFVISKNIMNPHTCILLYSFCWLWMGRQAYMHACTHAHTHTLANSTEMRQFSRKKTYRWGISDQRRHLNFFVKSSTAMATSSRILQICINHNSTKKSETNALSQGCNSIFRSFPTILFFFFCSRLGMAITLTALAVHSWMWDSPSE